MEKENKKPPNRDLENIPLNNKELFSNIFDKSSIATLFYNKEGKLISINQSALNIFEVHDLNDIKDINLFDFSGIDLDYKNKLEREDFVEFQYVINLEFIKPRIVKSENEKIIYTIWTIKRLNSGYLVQIQDVTDQKKAEKRYHELFNNPLNGFVILKPVINKSKKLVNFILLEANTTFEKLTGLKREKIVNKRITEFIQGIEDTNIIKIFANVTITGKPAHFEQFFPHVYKYFDIAAFLPHKGQLMIFFADITNKKLAEENLQDTFEHLEIEKKQLDAIVENIPVGVIIAEAPSGKFLLANKQIAEIWRYPPTASADEFKKYKGFHPDGRPYKTYEWPLSRSIRAEELVKDEEIEILRGNKTKGWLSVSSVPVYDNKGDIIMGIVIDLDITKHKQAENELKKSKKRLEAIIQGSPVPTFIIDRDHNVIHWNKAIEEYSGINVEDIIGTKDHWKAFHTKKKPTMVDLVIDNDLETISRLYSGKYKRSEIVEGAYEFENFFSTMGGNGRWLRGTVSTIEDYNGNVIGAIEILEDITERKYAEEKLKEARDDLEEQVKKRTTELEEAYKSIKESETKFRELFNKALDMLTLSEVKENAMPGKFIEVNEAASEVLGYDKEEFLTMAPLDLFAPEQKSEIPRIAEGLNKMGYTTFESVSVTKNGRKIPVEVNVHIFQLGGKDVALAMIRDITERKRAEEELKRSKTILEEASSLSKIGAYEWDMKKDEFILSKEWQRIHGFKINRPSLKDIMKIIHPNDIVKVQKALDEVLKGIKLYDVEYRIINQSNGEIRYIHAQEKILRDKNGKLTRMYGVAEDITEHKHAGEQIKRLVDIINSSDDAIIGEDLNGIIFSWNRGAEKMYGYSASEIIGKHISIFMKPSEWERVSKFREEIKKGNNVAHYDAKRIKKDGNTLYVSVTLSPVKNVDGEIIGVSVIARDATEHKKAEKALKESEEKLNATIESSPDSITVMDLNLNIVSCNQATAGMYGVSSKEEIIGLNAFDLVDPEDRSILAETIEKNMREEKSITLELNLLTKKDNRLFPAEISGNVIRDAKGNPIGFVAITKDITNRKNAEKERETLINELKRSNEELQQFAYVASHDLQEPLRTIASFTQLLARRYKGQLDKDADEFIDFIVDGTQRMQAMIKDLLQYSRVQTRGEEFKPTDVQNTLNKALFNLKVSIEENNAEITHDKLPIVIADEKQLMQLFQNLISNAIKFKKPDVPPKIHVSAKKEEGKYIFGVSDNGIGIETEYKERIFELFQRLHTRDKYKGTGIGLAVAKKIVDRHGGIIWVESEPGKGSTFYFTIPN